MPAWGKAATAALAARDLWATPKEWISPWGTDNASTLPHCLEDNPMPQGHPWGQRTAKHTNMYKDTPNTGVTRHYTWAISKEPCAPDGYENTCLLINGQFPGPLVEANWGDWIEVTVTNNIPDEGTTIHWHGLLQKATPYEDGVPGYTQCPIAPQSTFTYRFQADLYGSSWYHSHYSAQYGSGLFGPIVIYGPKDVEYDDDLGPIMISDYFHGYYTEEVEKTLANPASGEAGPPLANNNLINGKTNNGGPGIATFRVKSGKTYRMRIVNTSAASLQKFTIDGYTFTIFANDFIPVVPYETDVVTLAVGQRNDILFKATGKPTDSVWMRGYRPPPCAPTAGNEEVLAAIFYEDADTSVPPSTQPGPNAYSQYCGNDPLEKTVPLYPLTPPKPDVSQNIELNFTSNGTALLWYMNGQTFRADYNDPMLLEAKLGHAQDLPPIRNAHIYPGSVNSILFVIENPINQPHPMHLHGHNIWVLQEGPCTALPGEAEVAPAATSSIVAQSATSAQPNGPSTTSYPASYTPASDAASGSAAPAASASGSPGNYTKRDTDAKPRIQVAAVNEKRGSYTPPANSCWDGSVVNPQNPQRRDVQMLQAMQYIVIQWVQDNPGVWPLHCHIAWHLNAGMSWTVIENPDAIEKDMQIPSVMAETCRGWAAYTKTNVVDEIGSGL